MICKRFEEAHSPQALSWLRATRLQTACTFGCSICLHTARLAVQLISARHSHEQARAYCYTMVLQGSTLAASLLRYSSVSFRNLEMAWKRSSSDAPPACERHTPETLDQQEVACREGS